MAAPRQGPTVAVEAPAAPGLKLAVARSTAGSGGFDFLFMSWRRFVTLSSWCHGAIEAIGTGWRRVGDLDHAIVGHDHIRERHPATIQGGGALELE